MTGLGGVQQGTHVADSLMKAGWRSEQMENRIGGMRIPHSFLRCKRGLEI